MGLQTRTQRQRNEEARKQRGETPKTKNGTWKKTTWDRAYNGARGSRSVARKRTVYKDTAQAEQKRSNKMPNTRLNTSGAGT
jgi:hypothetical protein